MRNNQDFTLIAVGQSLIKRDIRKDSSSEFRQLQEITRNADIAFTNFEGTISGSYGGWPTKPGFFAAPDPMVLDVLLDMGFNALALSNNHAFDLGSNGILSTLEEVEKRKFLHAGIGVDLTEAAKPRYRETSKGRVALVAMDAGPAGNHVYAMDGTQRVPSRPGVNPQRVQPAFVVSAPEMAGLRAIREELGHHREMARYREINPNELYDAFPDVVPVDSDLNFYGMRFQVGEFHERRGLLDNGDLRRNMAAIADARSNADFVIAYLHHHHWEAKWESVPDWARNFAHQCIDAGADIYVSHGVPLLQPIEIYQGRPIFHSLGNFIFHSFNAKGWFHDHIWRSVVATCRYRGNGALSQIELDPVVIGGEKSMAAGDYVQRDVPYLASQEYGEKIMNHLRELSRPFGTEIVVSCGRGYIYL